MAVRLVSFSEEEKALWPTFRKDAGVGTFKEPETEQV
jgi:hypothetical protein